MSSVGTFKSCLIFFILEALILSSATSFGANVITAAQQVSNQISGQPPQAPQSGGTCVSTWWNPTTWVCTVSTVASGIWYGVQVVVYYITQVIAAMLVPFVIIGSVSYYSGQYWWLAVINALVLIMMIFSIVHGLI